MAHPAPHWSTASFGDAAETSPGELSELGDHLATCSERSKRMAAVRFGVHALNGFVTTRMVTTLALAVALIGFVLLVS
jgi:hypothetical protein